MAFDIVHNCHSNQRQYIENVCRKRKGSQVITVELSAEHRKTPCVHGRLLLRHQRDLNQFTDSVQTLANFLLKQPRKGALKTKTIMNLKEYNIGFGI